MKGQSFSENGVNVTITDVTQVEGDCDLNQRKGKILYIYDLVLTLLYEGIYLHLISFKIFF